MEYLYNGQWFEVQIKAVDTIPIGAIIDYPSLTAPYGYLLCDGRAVSRTEYADLFAVYGTQFGAGDGSTTFNLPDYSGRTGVGIDENDTDFNAIGKTLGSKTHKHLSSVGFDSDGHFYGHADNNGNPVYGDEIIGNVKRLLNQNFSVESNQAVREGYTQEKSSLQPSIVSAYYVKYEQSVGVVANVHNESNSSEQDVYSCKYINDINTYSTDEVFTGKFWIDGRKIYSRTFTGTISSAGQWLTVPNSIINNYRRATACTGIYGGYLPCPAFINNDYSIALQYNASYGVQIFANGYTSGDVDITIEYTKTTD